MKCAVLLVGAAFLYGGCDVVAGLGEFHAASGVSSSGAGAATTSGAGGGCADHVLISEAQEQSDFVELYNPTAAAVDLADFQLVFRTGSGGMQSKWTGSAGERIEPGQYYLLAYDDSRGPSDAMLTARIADDDPMVGILVGAGGEVVDSLCVCSDGSCSFNFKQAQVCGSPTLVGADFFDSASVRSAQRTSCADSDQGTDFMVACPTPRAAYQAEAECQ